MIKFLDKTFFKWTVNVFWSEYYRPVENYQPNWKIIKKYFFFQKIMRINGPVKWPVHFTSLVMGADRIKKGFMCDPGDSPNCYIQAFQGINLGSNVEIAPGCRLISSNHDLEDFSKAMPSKGPIEIGNNVWIGANCVILPGVKIGSNVVIGAGSVVTKNIPDNSIAVGNPCKVIKKKASYAVDITTIKLNRKFRTKRESQ
jgi:acetyltransferase-like isoleucine patch superfamily enzyme